MLFKQTAEDKADVYLAQVTEQFVRVTKQNIMIIKSVTKNPL